MSKRKYGLLKKGDVIRTEPEEGYYGVAVVLSEPQPDEISPGRFSYPLCHIAVTPLIFKHEITMENIDISKLEPLVFQTFALREDGVKVAWRTKPCVDIYTYRNKANLPVIGNIDPAGIYKKPLTFDVDENTFHLCGDIKKDLGREAYIEYMRRQSR